MATNGKKDETPPSVGEWLEDLASDAPAPGGGAAAALNVAVGAALIEMVCNLTIGKPRYAEHEATMTSARERAGEVRQRAAELMDEDAEAFAKVSAAYKLPKDSEEQQTARTAAIQKALERAAEVPLETVGAAARVIELAGEILDGANVNVISDVAVAAESARAGLSAAAINVDINLAAMSNLRLRGEIVVELVKHRGAMLDADQVVVAVKKKIDE